MTAPRPTPAWLVFLLDPATPTVHAGPAGGHALPVELALALAGPCMLCRQAPVVGVALVAAAGRGRHVCEECLGYAADIVAEERAIPDEPEGGDLDAAVGGGDGPGGATIRERVELLDRARAFLHELTCTFCGVHRADTEKLVAGPDGMICAGCVDAAGDALAAARAEVPVDADR